MKKKVSILIPCYNCEEFVGKSIESALRQTWDNKEIIVVDDGSTDRSFEIAKSYESDIVKVFKKNNKGLTHTRNFAFNHSNGEYIQTLDSDDLLSPDKVKSQMRLFEKFGDDVIAYCPWSFFFSEDGSDAVFKKIESYVDYDNPVDMLLSMWLNGWYVVSHSWMFHRKLVDQVGGWDENLWLNEDWEFMCRVLIASNGVKFSDAGKAYYRKGPPSMSGAASTPEAIGSILKAMISREKVIRQREDSYRVRVAAATNYYRFGLMLTVYGGFENEIVSIRGRLQRLGDPPPYKVGGRFFQVLIKIFGYWGALRIKRLQMKMKRPKK